MNENADFRIMPRGNAHPDDLAVAPGLPLARNDPNHPGVDGRCANSSTASRSPGVRLRDRDDPKAALCARAARQLDEAAAHSHRGPRRATHRQSSSPAVGAMEQARAAATEPSAIFSSTLAVGAWRRRSSFTRTVAPSGPSSTSSSAFFAMNVASPFPRDARIRGTRQPFSVPRRVQGSRGFPRSGSWSSWQGRSASRAGHALTMSPVGSEHCCASCNGAAAEGLEPRGSQSAGRADRSPSRALAKE